jgi:hypothetical protein
MLPLWFGFHTAGSQMVIGGFAQRRTSFAQVMTEKFFCLTVGRAVYSVGGQDGGRNLNLRGGGSL